MSTKPTICFYLQDSVEILDFAGPMEVFTIAGFNVFTVAKNRKTLTTQGVLKFTVDYSIDEAPSSDILAFFGGNADAASNDPEVIKWIRSRQPSTQYFFSVCTGAYFLAKAGILDNHTVTTFHLSINSLQKRFPKINVLAGKRFVEDKQVITTAGISAGIDGALHLVTKLKGLQAAESVVEYMEYDKWVPGQGLILN